MKRTIWALLLVFSLLLAAGVSAEETAAGAEKALSESTGDYLHRYPDQEITGEDGSVTEVYTGISLDAYNDYMTYLRDREKTRDAATRARVFETEGENRSIVGELKFDKADIVLTSCYYTETNELHVTYPQGTYDARVRTAKEQYDRMVKMVEAGDLGAAVQAYRKIPEQSAYQPAVDFIAAHEELATAISQNRFQIKGEYVSFGRYEQDGDSSNGPEAIEWLVLDVQDGKSLLVSRYALDTLPYNTEYSPVTWETSSIRAWLNGEFIGAAFNAEELGAVLEAEVDNSAAQGNTDYPTDGGSNTKDRVFLLSCSEAARYFADDESRKCIPTAAAISKGARTGTDGTAAWWLRSPGSLQGCAMRISGDGTGRSAFVDYDEPAVRPAFWIDLNSDFF